MSIFRVEHTTGFTVMSNHHLRDKNLSLKAKGLLSQMLCPRSGITLLLGCLISIARRSTPFVKLLRSLKVQGT